MNKHLVVSYDPDQQEWHYDVVFAADEDAAKQRILDLREYCTDADVITMPELERMTKHVLAVTQVETEAWLRSLLLQAQG